MSKISEAYVFLKGTIKKDYTASEFVDDFYHYALNDFDYFNELNHKYFIKKAFQSYVFNDINIKNKANLILRLISNVKDNLNSICDLEDSELVENCLNIYYLNKSNSIKFLSSLFEFIKRNDDISKDQISALILYVFADFESIHNFICEKGINSPYFMYDGLGIAESNFQKEFNTNISKLSNEAISELNIVLVVSLFGLNYDAISLLLDEQCVSKNLQKDIDDFIQDFSFPSLNDDKFTMYNEKHCGLETGKKTLEELGNHYNVTRERIRQIIKKISDHFAERYAFKKRSYFKDFYYGIKNPNQYPYLTIKDIYEGLNEYEIDENYKNALISTMQDDYDDSIKFNKQLKIFYDNKILNEKDFLEMATSKYPFFISKSEVAITSDNVFAGILSQDYTNNEKCFIRKGIHQKQMFDYVLEKHFPNGLEIRQNYLTEQAKEFLSILNEEFGVDLSDANGHAVESTLARTNSIMVDKSIIKSRIYCGEIPDDLFEDILDYINKHGPIVTYKAIFNNFKDELEVAEINNYYYLKSLLDERIASIDYLKNNADFISVDNTDLTFTQLLKETIKSKDCFTLDELRKEFPGTADSVFNTYINSLDLYVFAGKEKYVKLSAIGLTDDIVSEIKEIIDESFDKNGYLSITATYLFNQIVYKNYEIISKTKYIEDGFILFSIIQKIFPDYYYFRPVMSRKKENLVNVTKMLYQYLSTLDSFNHKTVIKYIDKMGLRDLDSYLKVMNEMSKDFVQIDRETMVNKKILKLSNTFFENFGKELDYYISNFYEIDTRTFKGYSTLPKLTIGWNSYLLAGLVKTFFNDQYSVINTDIRYVDTNFIIRRIK